MNRKQIIGLAVAVFLFILTGTISVFVNRTAEQINQSALDSIEQTLTGGVSFSTPLSDYVAVVRVEGTIQQQGAASLLTSAGGYQHSTTMDYIDRLMEDGFNTGILLYVDSPGGTIYESEELYRKLVEYKEETGRPVWTYMAHYAASGGYYVSAPSDRIYANPNTTTGSIGVIMAGYDLSGLYEKLGIRYVSITSGSNKDSSTLSDEQVAIYQSQVDEAYDRFVEIVADGRNMSDEQVRELADGRTYTARQALENGLIDEIGLYDDVREQIASEAGTDIFYELDAGVATMFSSLFGSIRELIPKSESQILQELAEETQGGLQYYVQGLQ
ncbi:MAG: signal peptide peptidase SppA [Eubacteriales bacterium]|nr:signal peptide peptidase SppA [Eubacteriales bacterium]